ncbi:kinase-like domain-containing protein [Mycena rebaudengoi]|nr:kinase-like domain-containing protein [Mycena rebaudengoi]
MMMIHLESKESISHCADAGSEPLPTPGTEEPVSNKIVDAVPPVELSLDLAADMTPITPISSEAEAAYLDWDSYPPEEFGIPWRSCANLLLSHGLRLWGTPDYEDTTYDECFPKRPAPDPFHPQDDEDFVHRLATDWEQPHLIRRPGFVQESIFLHLALDPYFRHVIIKVVPAGSEELQIMKELSSYPLRADSRNHTIPVLRFICGVRVEFAVQACWGEHWTWPPFDSVQSRFEMARQLLEGLQFMHDNNITHGDIHPRNIVWNRSDKRPLEVRKPGLEKPLFHSQFGFRMAYIDFGAAMKVSIGRRSLGTGIRPPSKWSAPEQLLDEPYDACAADVFMLGRVLQEELAEGRIWYNISSDDQRYHEYDALLASMAHMDPDMRPTASMALSSLQTLL